MHFKAKIFFSKAWEKKQPETFLSTGLSCFFDTMLPQQLTQNHIKRELMSCSLASKHTPPGHSNCCHCNLILACRLQISVPLVVCCKNLIHTLLSKYCGFFLCNCSLASIVQKDLLWHICCIHSVTDKTKRLAILSNLSDVKMHTKLVLDVEGNRPEWNSQMCLLLTMFIFIYKRLILQGDSTC